MVEEARLGEGESGLVPETEGWFVVNVRDATWIDHEKFGAACVFEGRDVRFGDLGINIRVLQPGQPNALYHDESVQEDVLVLAGECTLLVEGEERPLRAWDFAHLPPGTEHIVVGAGEGPCVVLMTGARKQGKKLRYPVSELAARYGASVEKAVDDPSDAYAGYSWPERRRPKDWDSLPWAR